MFSFGLDVDWLISDYYPVTLGVIEDQFIYNTQQSAIFSRNFAWYMIMMNIFLKTISLAILILDSKVGNQMINEAWDKLHLFFPPTSTKIPENLNVIMESRIIAIGWVELISSLLIIILATYANLRLSWAPQFQSRPVLTTLPNILYLKGISGTLLVMALMRNCNKRAIFGCLVSSSSKPDSPSSHNRKVLIDRSFLRFNGTFKCFTTVIGICTWYSLLTVWSLGGGDIPKEVRIVLGMLATSMVLTDVLALALFVTVFCYAYNMSDLHTTEGINLTRHGNSSSRRNILDYTQNEPSRSHLQISDTTSNRSFLGSRLVSFGKPLTAKGAAFILADNVACDPTNFSLKWKLLGPGTRFDCATTKIPTINECNMTFEQHRFFPVASGVVDGGCILRLFLIAKYTHSPVDAPILCLCELSFEPIKMHLQLELKLSLPANIMSSIHSPRSLSRIDVNVEDFVEKLPLVGLFGASKISLRAKESLSIHTSKLKHTRHT